MNDLPQMNPTSEPHSRFPSDVKVFHAGTDVKSDTLVTSGGRVLAVNAVGPTLEDAVTLAYKGVDCVKFDGMTYRKDIAHR